MTDTSRKEETKSLLQGSPNQGSQNERWFYQHDGTKKGPVDPEALCALVESRAVLYLPEGINNVAAYILLLLVLMVRPQGLFGIQSKRRV